MSTAADPSLTLDDLDRFLDLPSQTESLSTYVDAAAVLVGFDPLRLRPMGGNGPPPSERFLAMLVPLCEQIAQGPTAGLWMLAVPHRRAGLRRLADSGRLAEALDANPDRPDTPLQRMLERLLGGREIELDGCEREELAALLTLHDWLDGILTGVPDRDEIRAALVRSDLLAPMRRLAERGFVGRGKELARLEHHLESDITLPLFVFGPGGIGKSTLLARLILDRVIPRGIPLAYVDLDRPTIRADRPSTLLIDLIAQLEPQIGLAPGTAEAVAKEISYSVNRTDADRAFESAVVSDDWTINLFGDVVGRALGYRSALVVIDTFEEAQFLGSDVVSPLLDFLFTLARSLPQFRLVLAGRALPPEYLERAFPEIFGHVLAFGVPAPGADPMWEEETAMARIPLPVRPVNLGMLDQESARTLLRGAAGPAGVALSDSELDDVIRVVSRNPMCLKLAGRLLRAEGVEKLRSSPTEFLAEVRGEKIQAFLYGRILRHLHDDDARAIAYPGLVVRRLAPDVIREVLAEPCGLKLTPEHNEHDLVFKLRNEAALLEVDPTDGSLRHRTDVRRAMLADLEDQVDEETVRKIDRAAVAFYSKWSDPVSRGEEIYHRLRLNEPSNVLDDRWLPEVASRLKNAGEELPAQQRLWLAAKLGVTLDESVRRTATQEAWEDQAVRSADRFLRSRSVDLALAIFEERTERLPRSKLFLLEAEAHRLAGDGDRALAVARAGVGSASRAGAIDMALELLMQMVVVEEGRGNLEAGDRLLREARAVASHSNNEVLRFRIAVTGLRLHRHLFPDAHAERAKLRRQATDELTESLLAALRSRPVLLREAAAELAKEVPRIASLAIETLGIEVSNDAQAAAFGQVIVHLDNTQAEPFLGESLSNRLEELSQADLSSDAVRQFVSEQLTSRDTQALRNMVSATAAETELLRDFRDYFRAGVDSVLHRGEDEPERKSPSA